MIGPLLFPYLFFSPFSALDVLPGRDARGPLHLRGERHDALRLLPPPQQQDRPARLQGNTRCFSNPTQLAEQMKS